MQLFVYLDMFVVSLVELSCFYSICHTNRMDSERESSQTFNNNPQLRPPRGRPKNR